MSNCGSLPIADFQGFWAEWGVYNGYCRTGGSWHAASDATTHLFERVVFMTNGSMVDLELDILGTTENPQSANPNYNTATLATGCSYNCSAPQLLWQSVGDEVWLDFTLTFYLTGTRWPVHPGPLTLTWMQLDTPCSGLAPPRNASLVVAEPVIPANCLVTDTTADGLGWYRGNEVGVEKVNNMACTGAVEQPACGVQRTEYTADTLVRSLYTTLTDMPTVSTYPFSFRQCNGTAPFGLLFSGETGAKASQCPAMYSQEDGTWIRIVPPPP